MTLTCDNCGLTSPDVIRTTGHWNACQDILACEARQMVRDGEPIQAAVDHAQGRDTEPAR